MAQNQPSATSSVMQTGVQRAPLAETHSSVCPPFTGRIPLTTAPTLPGPARMPVPQPQVPMGFPNHADSNNASFGFTNIHQTTVPTPSIAGTSSSSIGSAAGGVSNISNATRTTNEMNDCLESDGWMDVIHTRETDVEVSNYFQTNLKLLEISPSKMSSVDPELKEVSIPFEAGMVYMFRVSAVNSLGIGSWSQPVAYKTSTPGLPEAPTSIKISKVDGGAEIKWEPSKSSGVEIDFAVFLAVNPASSVDAVQQQTSRQQSSSNPTFERVYMGRATKCIVTNSVLENAKIDVSREGKPSFIFRIAARNENGFGPSTQVRWLQG